MATDEIKSILSTLPEDPGVYRFLGSENQILYVGKAKNLKRRVTSYFQKEHDSARLRILVRKIVHIEITIVSSEKDALLLENSLIKSYQPRYNVNLKDDKTYPYIAIKKERFPRVFLTRYRQADGAEYLGPYTSAFKARMILDFLKKMFPLRTCSLQLTEKNIAAAKFKICLEYHIGNCLGPCESRQSEESYNENIRSIKQILKGNYHPAIKELKNKMYEFAEDFQYEKAQQIKEKLDLLEEYLVKSTVVSNVISDIDVLGPYKQEDKMIVNYMKIVNGTVIRTRMFEAIQRLEETDEELLEIVFAELYADSGEEIKELLTPLPLQIPDESITQTIPQRGEKKQVLDLAVRNAEFYYKQKKIKDAQNEGKDKSQIVLEMIKQDFRLKELPVRIECFDNSNFQGTDAVASMVCFINGKPAKSEYRHFHIKTVAGPDDFASMEEVVYRRYKRMLEEGKPLPQLIIIDGGKGQLASAMISLKKLNLEGRMAIAGIAKRLEEIYFPYDPLPLHINKKSVSLKVIQRLRNEAHRFAISFHRDVRSKNFTKSSLLEIEGVGIETVQKLFKHFKSYKKIKEATLEDLLQIIDRKKAQILFDYFRKTIE